MKKAVIFDLFGTLVDIFSRAEYTRVLEDMAEQLGTSVEAFSRAWIALGEARTTGRLDSPRGSVLAACKSLGVEATSGQIDSACAARYDYYKRNLKPRRDAETAIRDLKSAGYLTGLISNCATELLGCWHDIPLAALIDFPVFSCEEHIKKPDARIFQICCRGLGVSPSESFYVADGDSGELAAATSLGMTALRIRAEYETEDALRDREEGWPGPTFFSLTQVIDSILSHDAEATE